MKKPIERSVRLYVKIDGLYNGLYRVQAVVQTVNFYVQTVQTAS